MSIDSLDAPPNRAARSMPALMSACVVVVVAMVAAINLALPDLSTSDLHPTSTQLLWVVDSYILVFGCALIPAGALGDRLGRKGALLAGLAVFAAGCLASAGAPTVQFLLVARAVTGFGAALVMPATLSLLLQVTEPARTPQAIAVWSAATGAAGALGNLGGGVVLQWLTWRGLFLVIGPIALVLALVVACLAPPGVRHDASLDPLGTLLLTTAVLSLLLGIIEAPELGWTSPLVLASVAATAVLVGAFVVHGIRSDTPMLDPRVFTVRRLRTGTVGVGAVFFGLFALFFVNAQFLQYAKGYAPLVTGIAILPLPVAMVIASRRSIAVAGRLGVRTTVVGGMLLLSAGLVAFSFLDGSTPYPAYAVVLVAVATGMGLSVPSLSAGIVASLPPERAGAASGLNSAVREVGAALGVAVVGSVLASRFAHDLPRPLRSHAGSASQALAAARDLGPAAHSAAVDAFTAAMATGVRVVAVFTAVAAIAAAAGLRDRPPSGPGVRDVPRHHRSARGGT